MALLAEIVCASVVTRPFVILKQVQSSKYKVHQLVTAYTKQDKLKKKRLHSTMKGNCHFGLLSGHV